MEPQLGGGVSFRYVESSALVAAGLEGDATAMRAIRGEGVRVGTGGNWGVGLHAANPHNSTAPVSHLKSTRLDL